MKCPTKAEVEQARAVYEARYQRLKRTNFRSHATYAQASASMYRAMRRLRELDAARRSCRGA